MSSCLAAIKPRYLFHLAAESHVDRSITGPSAFIQSNIVGTSVLLELARAQHEQADHPITLIHVSTDEVYGSLGSEGLFTESTRYDPSSPYSASKAASDHLVRAWHRTYGVPSVITNCSNNYGPYQYPEKLIPVVIRNALSGQAIPVYGQGINVRDWLYVDDHVAALHAVATRGQLGETYNIGGNTEVKNIDLVKQLCSLLDELRPKTEGSYTDQITFVQDRLGHDLRYAIDNSKIKRVLDWQPQTTLSEGLRQTVQWYINAFSQG